jgi:hypothetical protein
MASYDEIVSNKSCLEFEINTYRRLLESEEAHVNKINGKSSSTHFRETTKISTSTTRQSNDYPTPIPQTQPTPIQKPITIIPDTKINQTEMQAKTTFQRSAKGINILSK